jgi:hypothetical protein
VRRTLRCVLLWSSELAACARRCPELQRRHAPRQRFSLRARRTRAPGSFTGDPCERRRSTTGCAPPGTGSDVAASLCRPPATRRRCYTRRDSPRRRQGCCPQRRAQETGVVCRGRRRHGPFWPSSRPHAAAALVPTRFHRAARCSVTDGQRGRAMNAALRVFMVKRARSVRSRCALAAAPSPVAAALLAACATHARARPVY